ncbi:MAG: amidase family protein [Gemmatimonadota bacterium]
MTRSAAQLLTLLRNRALSAEELTATTLDRIADLNPRINAIVTLNHHALEDARALDARRARGEEPGPLFGLPVGIKDVTPVAGVRTTFGSPMYRDHVPTEDALVVQRFRAAGAIIIGKTNTPEFAAGGNTFNEVFGRTRNPWNLDRSAGGSTGGGAAALATGMIALAEGTDLGGSLRIPASFCGIVGLRPSPGLIPTYPSDYVWDTLQVTGTMARTAEDVAISLQAVCGPSSLAPLAQPVMGRDFVGAVRRGIPGGLRIAYCADLTGIGVDDGIENICRSAVLELQQAGATVAEIALDLSETRNAFLALRGYWMVAHQHTRLDRRAEFGTNVANNVRAGLETSMQQFAAAEHVRGKLWHRFRTLFERFDYVLTPCMAVPPFPVEQNYPDTVAGRKLETYVDWIAPTFVLSLTGLPVASVPCGLDAEGLPVGLQIVGKPQGEEAVLALAGAVQAARPIGLPSL